MEFEEPAFGAPALGADERAAALVASPDLAPHGSWNVTGVPGTVPRRTREWRCRRSASFQMFEQHGQRAIDDFGRIPARHGVPQQILNTAQLVVRLLRDGDLKLVALGRERGDDGARP